MILGMSFLAFIHVLVSLIGIVAGLVVLAGMLRNRRMNGWTLLFLAATIATSLTGLCFGFGGFTPPFTLGIISLVALAVSVMARYGFRLEGRWRALYVIGAVAALYFNVFVLVVQAFAKIVPLRALVRTGTEPPFIIAQGVVLVAFLIAGFLAVRRFRPAL